MHPRVLAIAAGSVLLMSAALALSAATLHATPAEDIAVSPLHLSAPNTATPGSVIRLSPAEVARLRPADLAVGDSEEPAAGLPEYVLPAIEVRAWRTLSAPDRPIVGGTDNDTKGVHRYEADAASLRLALNLAWLNPLNW